MGKRRRRCNSYIFVIAIALVPSNIARLIRSLIIPTVVDEGVFYYSKGFPPTGDDIVH